MPLTNQQYDSILREYEEKQNRAQRQRLQRIAEIYTKIPEYEEIERSVSSVSVAQAKKLLDGDEHALLDLKHTLHRLSEKKLALLLSAGYPEDYLESAYDCPHCKDTGYIDGQKCHCLKQSNPISKKYSPEKIFLFCPGNSMRERIYIVSSRQWKHADILSKILPPATATCFSMAP